MDGLRFDTLVRTLATSRRTTRKTLLGAGLGLLLAGRRRDAAANCKKVGRSCTGDDDCCKDALCRLSGVCECEAGFTDCSGKCKDLSTDKKHCGACNNDCGRGGTCCSGDCAGDFQTDPDHCGGCGNFCRGICSDIPGQPPQCHGPRCCGDGECVEDVQANDDHCGACDNACREGETCCAGACVDLAIFSVDPANCGTCGTTCGESEPNCVGFCTGDGGCPAGADPCEDGFVGCGDECICSQSTEGGTLCGDTDTPDEECGQCQSTTDCVSLFGPGHFCTKAACCGRGGKVCRRVCTD
jgi:hypothetical protein